EFDPQRVLLWSFLEEELATSARKNMQIILVTHVPFGAKNDLNPELEAQALSMIAPHSSRVIVALAGDLSRNEIRRIPLHQDSSSGTLESSLLTLISGGLSPRKGGGPSLRRLDLTPQNGATTKLSLSDWTDWTLPLFIHSTLSSSINQWKETFKYVSTGF